jgi:hypothetical protein
MPAFGVVVGYAIFAALSWGRHSVHKVAAVGVVLAVPLTAWTRRARQLVLAVISDLVPHVRN